MKSKRHKKIKRYKITNRHEYAVIFKDSEQLIDFVCGIKGENIISSSLYTQNGCYILLFVSNKTQRCIGYAFFKDKPHINEIKHSGHTICERDAIFKMQQAFIKP